MAALKGILKNDIFFSFGILKNIYLCIASTPNLQ